MTSKAQTTRHEDGEQSLLAQYTFTSAQRIFLSVIFLLLAVAAGLLYAYPMGATVGEIGFATDEAYIPLTFARNLIEHVAWSFHGTDMVISGTAAPLQVLLLVLIGIFVSDGIVASMVVGILSFAAVVLLTFRLGILLFPKQQWLAAMAALLIVFAPRLAASTVGGDPALLFTALILASATAYFARRSVLFFLFAGLAFWVRPDAIIFFLAAILHLVYHHALVPARKVADPDAKPVTGKQTAIGGVVFLVIVAGYLLMNLIVGGTLLPNAVHAELAYYSGSFGMFLEEVLRFYTYSWTTLLLLFALNALIPLAVLVSRRQGASLVLAAAYVLGTILVYALFHPVLRDHHLLLPTLPFLVLLGVWGLLNLTGLITWFSSSVFTRTLATVLVFVGVIIAVAMEVVEWEFHRTMHYQSVRYLLDRQANMGKWLAENTAPEARVATHAVGTAGYYGDRYLVDMKGTVTPEVVPLIGDLPALVKHIEAESVQYIAISRNEFEVVNVNPLVTSDRAKSGITEIFPYVPTRTHIMSQQASLLNLQATQLMKQDVDASIRLLKQSLVADPYSSRTNTLLGIALLQKQDSLTAETAFRNALELHPHYAPAMVPLGDLLTARKEYWEALRTLELAMKLNPESQVAQKSLDAASRAHRGDSLGGTITFSVTKTLPTLPRRSGQ